MAARIQIPAQAKRGEVIEIRVIIQHPMETGTRHDAEGKLIRRNVINTFACSYNGIDVFHARLTSGIAANPFLQLYTVATESGVLEFFWIDDDGVQGTERREIAVSG